MDFNAYISDFNAGDMRRTVEKWYTPDATFQSGRVNARSREEILEMLLFIYDGVRATLRPQTVLSDATHLFAEIDADNEALRDRLDFPLGPMRAGDRATMKLFCLMRLRDGLISDFRVGEWPANIGVSVAPPTT